MCDGYDIDGVEMGLSREGIEGELVSQTSREGKTWTGVRRGGKEYGAGGCLWTIATQNGWVSYVLTRG